jgi:hypothetical protein
MAEIRINATGGVKLYDADDSHYAQIVAGTITSNVDAITLGHDTVTIADNLSLGSDSAVLKFGADGDTTLTHTDGTGLTLNSTNKICFNDASQFIQGSSNAVLSLGATDEIDLTATAVDLNGTLNVSGVATFQSTPVFPDGSLAVADLDIDGATDIGAAIVDADLFIVDDGAGGTNRKVTASRIKTYAGFGVGDITGATEKDDYPADADEIILSDGGTLKRMDMKFMFNTPAFKCRMGSGQTISDSTWTLAAFSTKDIDTNSAFTNTASNYKFTVPSGLAGRYHFSFFLMMTNLDDTEQFAAKVYKNGSALTSAPYINPVVRAVTSNQETFCQHSWMMDLSAADYLQIYVWHNDGADATLDNSNAHWYGFRVATDTAT